MADPDTDAFWAGDGLLNRMTPHKRALLIGEIVTLMLHSPLHRMYRINDIGSVFLPPIHLDQFRIYRMNGRVVGLVTWAWLTELVEQNYLTGKYHLRPKDWNGGTRGWIVDFISPLGHTREIIRDLRQNVFPGKVGRSVRVAGDGKFKGIRRLHGAGYTPPETGHAPHRTDDA